MFIDLNKMDGGDLLLDTPVGVPDLEGNGGEAVPVSGAVLRGRVHKENNRFDLDATLSATVRQSCSRCLAPFETSLTTKFHRRLIPTVVDDPNRPAEAADDDADGLECPEGRFDVVQAVSEQLYLSLPLKPVCRDDCRGLCPSCGADRNERSCGCAETVTDPRWAPLLEFKKRLD